MSWTYVQSAKTKSVGGVSTLAVTLNGVTFPDLLRVSVMGLSANTNSLAISDNFNSVYIANGFKKNTSASNTFAAESWITAPTSGNFTITFTPNGVVDCEIAVCEYSYSAGATVNAVTPATNTSAGATNAQTTTAVTFSGAGNYLLGGTFGMLGTASWTNGANFVIRQNDTASYGICVEDRVNVTNANSPLAATTTTNAAISYAAIGVAYQEQLQAISPAPAIIPANHTNGIALTLTGFGTTWNNTTVFTASNAGVSVINSTVTNANAALIYVNTNSLTGVCTLGDGTFTSPTLTVVNATFAIAPPGAGLNVATLVNATATNTLWLSETAATLFNGSGVAGTTLSNTNVTANNAATFTITSGGTPGTLTVQDTSTQNNATFTVFTLAPTIQITPSLVPSSTNGTVLTLVGIHTNWNVNTVFTTSGVAGIALGTPTISSATTATLAINTSTSIGVVTLSDGSFTGNFTVTGAVINPYVCRSGQLAIMMATSPINGNYANILAINSNPTFAVNGNSIALGLYASQVNITNGGANYNAPTIAFSGGHGTGITAVINAAGINAGVLTNTYLTASNSRIYPTVMITNPGYGFLAGDTVTAAISDSNGTNATASVVLGPLWPNGGAYNSSSNTGAISTIANLRSNSVPFVAYQMLCGGLNSVLVQAGGHNYNAPSASLSGGNGTGASLGTPTLINGVINSVPLTNGGTGYNRGGQVLITATNGSGFVGFANPLNGVMQSVTIESGGGNYSGTLTAVFSGAAGLGGTGATFGTPTTVNGVIGSIPINTTGGNYTSLPTIAISDAAGTGAVAIPILSGPPANSVTTWSANNSWLTTNSGTVLGTTNAVMPNYTGQIEPLFNTAPTIDLGMNIMQPFGLGGAKAVCQNWLKNTNANWTGASNPVVTISDNSNGTLATAYAVVNSGGNVTGYMITCGGVNYVAPTGTVAAPATGGTTATIGAITVVNGVITAIATNTAGAGYGGSTIDGHPLAVNNNTGANGASTGGIPCTFAPFAYANQFNGLNNQGTPDMAGNWTFVADDSNPSFPMTARAYSSNLGTYYTAVPTNGTLIGGVANGKVWTFNVVRSNGAWPLDINIEIKGPNSAVSAPYTLSNEMMIAPNRINGAPGAYNRSVPMTPDQNLINWVTLNNTQGAASMRMWNTFPGFLWCNNVVDNSDLRPPSDFTWSDSVNRNLNVVVTQIRSYQMWNGCVFSGTVTNGTNTITGISNTTGFFPGMAVTNSASIPAGTYVTAIVNSTAVTMSANATGNATGTFGYVSPYVFTSNNSYPGTASSNSISGAPFPYYWTPPGNVSANNANWMGKGTGINGRSFVAELVTAAPHPFKTGQQWEVLANPSTNSVPVYDQASATFKTAPLWGSGNESFVALYVTGPSTFAIVIQDTGNITSTNAISNVAGVFNTIFTMTLPNPPGSQNGQPYESAAQAVAAVPGAGMHMLIPVAATDACANTLFATIRDILPVGRNLYIEFVNEHWNNQQQGSFQFCYSMASLLATGNANVRANNRDDFYTYQAAHYHQLAINVWNQPDINGNVNRGGSIKRIFAGQGGVSSVASNIVAFANLYNANLPPGASPIGIDYLMGANYIDIVNDVGVIAMAASTYSNYPQSLQYQSTTPFTMGMYVDWLRHFMFSTSGAGGYAAVQTTEPAVLAFNLNLANQGAAPQISCYEASIQTPVPAAVSPTDWMMRSAITHDAYYHPFFADADYAFHLAMQYGGAVLENSFNVQDVRAQTFNVIANEFNTPDSQGVYTWGDTIWSGQTWGRGDGSIDGNGNPTVNVFFNGTGLGQDLLNVSPKLQGWRTFAALSNPSGSSGGGGIASLSEEQLASIYYAGRTRRRVRLGGRIVGGMAVYYAGG